MRAAGGAMAPPAASRFRRSDPVPEGVSGLPPDAVAPESMRLLLTEHAAGLHGGATKPPPAQLPQRRLALPRPLEPQPRDQPRGIVRQRHRRFVKLNDGSHQAQAQSASSGAARRLQAYRNDAAPLRALRAGRPVRCRPPRR